MQSRVALERIGAYLEEEEVTDQVSSMKKDYAAQADRELNQGLGIIKGTFKWNEVEQNKDKAAVGKSTSTATIDSTTVVGADSSAEDQRFELKNVTVMFPYGKLSVIAGPTASGKTALLVGSHVPFKTPININGYIFLDGTLGGNDLVGR
jgi:hypothetical protein